MKLNKIPFNVKLMEVNGNKVKTLRPTTSQDVFDVSGGNFHEDGLFSTLTFGRVGEEERETRFSYIDIKTEIFHPIIFKSLSRLKGLYKDILLGKAYAVWDEQQRDFVSANELTGNTGFAFFMSHWRDIQYKESLSAIRNERVKLIMQYGDIATTSKILVMPAGLRDFEIDASGRGTQDEINDVYRKILNISRVIADTDDKATSPILDNTRRLLQERFNEIYDTIEKMIVGKKGFLQNKFGSRRVFNGTRNVISAMDTSTEFLGGANSPSFTDTVLGLFQVMRGALPITIYQLKTGWLSQVFSSGGSDTTARLINKKTLKAEYVDLPLDIRDKWVTNEGLEKVINSFREAGNRFKYVEVDGYYLGLIYKGPDYTFKIFGDIDELPDHLDRQYVTPLSYVELMYLSGYRRWNTLKAVITRYPVTDIGSTYPSNVYCKTTIVGEQRRELGIDWMPLPGDEFTALEFPTKQPPAFVDSQIIHSSRLAGLGAD